MSTLSQPQTAIVVVNYGTHRLLRENIGAVAGVDDATVYIVDNFSSDEERTSVERLCNEERWTLVALDHNHGFGGGNNHGASVAISRGAEVLVFLNPDATIDPTSLRLLRDHVFADPDCMVSPVIRRPDGSVWFEGNDVYLDRGRIRAHRSPDASAHGRIVPWLSGACIAISSTLWRRVDGFDEEYFMYWEDIDLSYRVQQDGGRVKVLDDATAIHDEGGSQQAAGGGVLSTGYFYFNIRNRLLFAARHLDAVQRQEWVRASGTEALAVLRRGGRRHLLQRRSPLLVAVRATRDGMRLTRAAAPADAPLVVMLSFPPPLVTSNPYNVLLADALNEVAGIVVLNFSWTKAFTAKYDVFHAHWPESMMDSLSAQRRAVKQILFLLLLLRQQFTRTAWVRTVHNLDLPFGISRFEAWLLGRAEQNTDLRVTINDRTAVPPGSPFVVIPHGDYVRWFACFPRSEVIAGRVLFFGTVRRYKGVSRLIEAFLAVPDRDLTLHVAGRLSSPAYADDLQQLASGDDRVTLSLTFIPDEELVTRISSAEVVVLPYPEMHNSGSVLASLSIGTPVLVPDNEVNRRLSTEVGYGWIHLFSGELTADHISGVLLSLRTRPPAADPDLTRRDWSIAGRSHVAAYRRARDLRKGMGLPSPTDP